MGYNYVGREFCINSVDNIHQNHSGQIRSDKLVVVPHLKFSCNGRITSIKAKVVKNNDSLSVYSFLSFQIWRPTSTDSYVYNKTVDVTLTSFDQVTENIVSIELTGNNTTDFQSGDFIGYCHPRGSHFLVTHINNTNGYKLYLFDQPPQYFTVVNITNAIEVKEWKQPLLQFTVGMNQLCI